jgi:hypothetical protein
MDELTSIACAMTYTDLRRRLIKAYRAHSADQDPNAEGDPRLEQKLAAKLGSYGPNGFILLLRELSEDLPELHVAARRDLAEYAIYLRDYWVSAPVVEIHAKPNLTPFSVPTTAAMTVDAA